MTRQLKPGDRAQWVSTSTGEDLHSARAQDPNRAGRWYTVHPQRPRHRRRLGRWNAYVQGGVTVNRCISFCVYIDDTPVGYVDATSSYRAACIAMDTYGSDVVELRSVAGGEYVYKRVNGGVRAVAAITPIGVDE